MAPSLSMWLAILIMIFEGSEAQEWCIQVPPYPFTNLVGAGSYDTAAILNDRSDCQNECFGQGLSFSAVWQLMYCFCGSSLSSATNISSTNCSSGSGIYVMNAQSNQVASVVNFVVGTGVMTASSSSVAINPSSILLAPPNSLVAYQYSYRDRNDIWELSPSINPLQRVINTPGIYEVRVQTLKGGSKSLVSEMGMQFIVYQPLANLNLTCQSYGVILIIANCTVTYTSGYLMSGTISVNGVVTENLTLFDTHNERGGAVPFYFNNNFVTGFSNAGIHISNTIYKYDGTVSFLEFNAVSAGSVNFLMLQPICSGSFCYGTSACSANPVCPYQLTCTGLFCSTGMTCSNICNTTLFLNQSALPVNYQISNVYAYTIPTTGYQTVSLPTPWTVHSGYRLGYFSQITNIIAARNLSIGESVSFYSSATSANVNAQIVANSVSINYVVHQLSAVSTPTQTTYLRFLFNTTGNMSIQLNLASSQQNALTVSSSLNIGLNINDTNFTTPLFSMTNNPTVIQLLPHTGINIQFFWTFGDSLSANTTAPTVNHTYTVAGSYNISVIVFNAYVSRNNSAIFLVQDPVKIQSFNGTTVSAPNTGVTFSVIMNSGTGYNCTLSGDNLVNQTLPGPNPTFAAIWPMNGFFNVRVDCYNYISRDFKTFLQPIMSNISGLQFVTLGGPANVSTSIQFSWTNGSNITFEFLFGNVSTLTTKNETLQVGWSAPVLVPVPSIVIGVLRAYNLPTEMILVANLTFTEVITGLQIIPSVGYIQPNNYVSFSVVMATGSSVFVSIAYGDGNSTQYQAPIGPRWVTTNFTNAYTNYGTYNVTIIANNTGGVSYNSTIIYVIGLLGTYTTTSTKTYMKIGDNFQLSTTRTSGIAALMANITINWMDSSSTFMNYTQFNESWVYGHSYSSNGVYNISILFANPLSTVLNNYVVYVINPIVNMRCSNNPVNTFPGGVTVFTILIDSGDNMNLTFTPGDGGAAQFLSAAATATNSQFTFNYAYNNVGNYTNNITNCNQLGCVSCGSFIQIQNPVVKSTFAVTNNAFVEYLTQLAVLTITYSGAKFPTGMSAYINYADGSNPTVVPLITSSPYQQSKNLSVIGYVNVNVTLSNLISSASYIVQMGAFRKFQGFTVETTWGSAMQGGLGPTLSLYPYNQMTYFTPKIGQGTPVNYVFVYIASKNTTAIYACNATLVNGAFSYMFEAMDTYNVSMAVSNPIDIAYFNATITIGSTTVDTLIIPPTYTLYPNYYGFVTLQWSAISSTSCICVSMGNGTNIIFGATSNCPNCTSYKFTNIQPSNNKIIVTVRYPLEGDYTIVVSVYGPLTAPTVNRTIPITSVQCAIPLVTMPNAAYTSLFTPQQGCRGNQIIVNALIVDIPCVATKNNFKLWTAQQLDPIYFTLMGSIDLSSIPTSNNTQLIIPPRFLNYGLYKLTFTVTMDKNVTTYTFYNMSSTYLLVTPTPIVVALTNGGLTQIMAGTSQYICMYPMNFSVDPDINPQNFKNWTWTWTCRNINEVLNLSITVSPKPSDYIFPATRTGCFGDGPGYVNFGNKTCFQGINMLASNSYIVGVNGTTGDGRSGSAQLTLQIVNGIPPTIAIQCMRPLLCTLKQDGPYAYGEVTFNPSDVLLLNASCIMTNGNPCPGGYWNIFVPNATSSQFIPLDPALINSFIQGSKSLQMSISPGFFTANSKLIRFQACYNSQGSSPDGMGCIQFFINPLPLGINCTVDKTVVSQSDNVCLNCTYIYPLMYRVFVNVSGDLTTLGVSNNGSFCSIIPYQQVNQTYLVRITNTTGAFVDYTIAQIQVLPLNNTALNQIINTLLSGTDKTLVMINAKGDMKTMAQVYLQYVSVISVVAQNQMSGIFGSATNGAKINFGGTGYTQTNVVQGGPSIENLNSTQKAMYETNRDAMSGVLNLMTSNLVNMVPGDVPSLYIVCGVVTAITNCVDNLNRQSQNDLSNKLVQLAMNLKSMQSVASRDDIHSIAKSILTANVQTDMAVNTQINNGILRDIQQSKDNFLDYDTNLESTKNSYMNVPNPASASNQLTLEVNSDFQSSLATTFGSNSVLTVNTVSKVVRDVTVVNDSATNLLTSKMQFFHQKLPINNFNGASYNSGRSTISLPNMCTALSSQSCSDPNAAVSLQILATPTNTKAAVTTSNGGGLPIPMETDVVSVNLFAGNNEGESSVNINPNSKITLTLSRDPSFLPPPFSNSVAKPQIAAPQAIPGTGSIYTGPSYFEQKLIMHQFQLNGSDQSAHFQMQFSYKPNCTQFLIVARLMTPPTLSYPPDGSVDPDNGFVFWGMIPTDTKFCYQAPAATDPDPFTFYINNSAFAALKRNILATQPSYSTIINNLYFGVRELTGPEWNQYTPSKRPPFPYTISAQVNTTYNIRIYSSGCYSNSDDFVGTWKTSNCTVGPMTTPMSTQCICNHLTTFASGFIVAPNTINFNYVFSNFDLSKNPTLFITEGVIFLFFILLIVWARRQDIKDLEKIGVTPLSDNDSSDMYLYEIIVDTSIRNNAGTKSKVYFILSGESDETEPRLIDDSQRSILQRGSVDRFLLAVPRSLGPLQYIRLWHDNSGKGKSASWYCNYFGVTDLQTKEKFHFLVNKWFAVEEDDCQIDRLIAVASPEELLLFGELFSRKMKLDLTENHLWLSIMARPPESRFTRVERVACCLLLMYLTMLTTCMFYQQDGPSKTTDNALVIGPLAITPREVWVGLVSGIIGFLPLFIVIDLFRRSQLKHGHANKLRLAVEEHLQEEITAGETKSIHSMATLVRNEEVNTPRPNTPGFRAPDQVNIQIQDRDHDEGEENDQGPKAETKVVRQRLCPWWVRIFTWILLFAVLIVACFFTTLYGIQFGDMACKKWISSMFISFFASVILIQPIKVIVLAIFFTLVCRNSSTFGETEFIDEEDELMNELGQRNGLMNDEEYLHEDLYTAPMKPHRRKVQPPSKDEVEKARERRLKEMKMYDVLREITFYVVFFITLLLVTYSFRDPSSYILKTEMEKMFIFPWNPDWQFLGINREDQFWQWALNVLVPGLRAPVWYNNQPQLYQRGFISDRNNRLMGYAVLRQVRVPPDSCTVYSYVKNLVQKCFASYSIWNEDTANYDVGWQTTNSTATEFSYQTATQLSGLPYLGSMNVYSGGGYVYQFRSDVTTLYSQVAALQANHWIDFRTRAIFIEFTTYNPNVNLFAICTFLLELPGSGGMWPSYRFEPANLLGVYSSGVTGFEIFCQALYAIFILCMIVKEIRNVIKQKLAYFKEFWNWVEMFLIFGSFACVAAFVYIKIGTSALTAQFQNTGGNSYMKFQLVGFWNEYMGYLTSFIVFAATIKFIRVLRFNKRIGMLGAVLKYCSKDLKQFCIIFIIMFLAFVMVFYSLFMDSLSRYHTFLNSMESSMQIALGKFAFLELYQREPIFGPIVFAFYVIFIIFVMLNMFVAILNEGFSVVSNDIELQSNDYEVVDFIITKLIMITGITKTKLGQKLIKTSVTDQMYKEIDEREMMAKVNSFPDKVDQLLGHISHIVSQGDKAGKKGFSKVIFEDPTAGSTTLADGNGYQTSRPSTATSNILRPRSAKEMPKIEK